MHKKRDSQASVAITEATATVSSVQTLQLRIKGSGQNGSQEGPDDQH
jgi:hypothetical protein